MCMFMQGHVGSSESATNDGISASIQIQQEIAKCLQH